MNKDNLDDRMKSYENIIRIYLLSRGLKWTEVKTNTYETY